MGFLGSETGNGIGAATACAAQLHWVEVVVGVVGGVGVEVVGGATACTLSRSLGIAMTFVRGTLVVAGKPVVCLRLGVVRQRRV